MKTTILAILLALTLPALAVSTATINFVWDLNDPDDAVVNYTMYELVGTAWQQVGVSTTNSLILSNISIGKHTYAVTAINVNGESDRSNQVVANTAKPAPPKGFKVFKITIAP